MQAREPTRWWITLASGLAVGTVCAALFAIPQARDLERAVGSRWLFALRGPVAPPEQVVVVTMNRNAAANISFPAEPAKFLRCEDLVVGRPPPDYVSLSPMPDRWPRCVHSRLIDKLVVAGASAIAFDVLFRERPPLPQTVDGDLQVWQDQNLAVAIRSAARVVLARKLEVTDARETLSDLSPTLAPSALGSGPMPLVPDSSSRIDRFLTFTTSDPATATLPVLALQVHWLDGYAGLAELLAKHAGELGELLPRTADDLRAAGDLQAISLLAHRLFRDDPTLARRVLGELERADDALLAGARAQIRGLVSLYDGDDSRLLNFYGRPGAIRTIAYDEVLTASVGTLNQWFRGRAVFVGYGELQQLEQVEHFATAMSSASGPDLSGVEIAATAFANLLRGESIRELSLVHSLAIVFLAGFLSTVLCQRLGYRAALALTLVALVAYGGIAMLEFGGAALRLPIVLPMLVAAPTGMLASFTWQYWTARRQRERLRRAFAYFVPRDVVSRIEHNAEDIGRSAEALECACVATDAANYTPLAETMSPERLTEFLNQYYEALFGGVANGGGFVSDVVGDAMLAIWPGRAPDTRLRMLNALLEMRDAAERFNERLAGNRLVTRFGVDWGRVALTTVGAGTHYEYRAVGDAVNTAARIQELNKKLGTRVLISQPALGEATSDFLLRDLGRFWLRGKSNPVHVFELLGRRALATGEQLDLCTAFAAAMAALHDGQGARAQDCFLELQGRFPTDGPTKLYVHALQSASGFQQGALKPD